MKKQTLALVACFLVGFSAMAQQAGEAGSLKGDGSYIVVGVILIIFIGIVLYLISIDRKLNKLEKENKK